MDSERRAHPRFACDLEAMIETEGSMMLDGRTVDISATGIAVTAAAHVRPGNDVILHLRLLLEGVTSDPLPIPARIVWSTPTQGQYQLGAYFRDGEFAPASRKGLEVLLRFLSGELELPTGASESGTAPVAED